MDLVIEHVACDICGAAKGESCTFEESEGNPRCHGMRLDTFMSEAPFEVRLREHMDIMERAREWVGPVTWKGMNDEPLMFTAEEYLEHTGREWPDSETT